MCYLHSDCSFVLALKLAAQYITAIASLVEYFDAFYMCSS